MSTHPLKLERLRRGLSQARLGKLSGVHPQTILGIENGHHEMSELTAWKLARALEYDPEDLLEAVGSLEDRAKEIA